MKFLFNLAFCFSLLIVFNNKVLAQKRPPIELQKLDSPPQLDGKVHDSEWGNITPLGVSMLFPEYNGSPTEKTEIRIAYTEDYIWASIRAYDSSPELIRINSLYRDRDSGDDTFSVIIDSFNSNETAMQFKVNPAGVRMDQLILNDAEPGRGTIINRDWNAFWDAEASSDETGWFAELRIPFSTLRFKAEEGEPVVMGIRSFRWIPRKGENQVFPLTSPNEASRPWLKPSLDQDFVLEDVESTTPIFITPFITTGLGYDHQLNTNNTDYERVKSAELKLGGDVKYSISSGLTADLTVNTDFAQVEADDQQLNVGRFSLFFPEKRPFFQERSDIFAFSTGGTTRLFYSRRIGLGPDGEPIGIYGGARIAGDFSGNDVGVLSMQTKDERGIPSENFGVFRVRRPVINQGSNVGGIYTHRISSKGDYNVAYGIDTNIMTGVRNQLAIRWAQTFDHELSNGLKSGRLLARFEKIGREGFLYNTEFVWSGKEYFPEVGFTAANDFYGGITNFIYGWVPDNSFYRIAASRVGLFTRIRNVTNSLEYLNIHNAWYYTASNNSQGELRVNYIYEDLPRELTIARAISVPSGSYEFSNISVRYRSASGKQITLNSSANIGSFYDGYRTFVSGSPVWNANSHLELGVEYLYNRIRFSKRDQLLNSHIVRARINLAFNKMLSAESYSQYNSINEKALVNLRIRYNFSEGHDLFVVLNGDLNTVSNDGINEPTLPISERGIFLVKYNRTFLR